MKRVSPESKPFPWLAEAALLEAPPPVAAGVGDVGDAGTALAGVTGRLLKRAFPLSELAFPLNAGTSFEVAPSLTVGVGDAGATVAEAAGRALKRVPLESEPALLSEAEAGFELASFAIAGVEVAGTALAGATGRLPNRAPPESETDFLSDAGTPLDAALSVTADADDAFEETASRLLNRVSPALEAVSLSGEYEPIALRGAVSAAGANSVRFCAEVALVTAEIAERLLKRALPESEAAFPSDAGTPFEVAPSVALNGEVSERAFAAAWLANRVSLELDAVPCSEGAPPLDAAPFVAAGAADAKAAFEVAERLVKRVSPGIESAFFFSEGVTFLEITLSVAAGV